MTARPYYRLRWHPGGAGGFDRENIWVEITPGRGWWVGNSNSCWNEVMTSTCGSGWGATQLQGRAHDLVWTKLLMRLAPDVLDKFVPSEARDAWQNPQPSRSTKTSKTATASNSTASPSASLSSGRRSRRSRRTA